MLLVAFGKNWSYGEREGEQLCRDLDPQRKRLHGGEELNDGDDSKRSEERPSEEPWITGCLAEIEQER